jgi:subtilase-type serine protease
VTGFNRLPGPGYALGSGRLNAEPFTGLSYQRYRRDSYQEKGGDAALSVNADTQHNLASTLGVRHTYGEVDTQTRQAFLAGGSMFDVKGSGLDQDSLVVEAGLKVGLSAPVGRGGQ